MDKIITLPFYIPKSSNKVTKKTVRCTVKVTNPEDTTDVAPDLTVQATAAPVPTVYGDAGKVSGYNSEQSNYLLNINASDKVHDISDILYISQSATSQHLRKLKDGNVIDNVRDGATIFYFINDDIKHFFENSIKE